MKPKSSENDILYDLKPKGVPDLCYREPDETTNFQLACISFVRAQSYTDYDIDHFVVGEELHVCIPLLSLKDAARQSELPDRDGFMGLMVSPQGYCRIAWTGEDEGYVCWDDDWMLLRHPAEIGDMRAAYSGVNFAKNRACDRTERNDYFKEYRQKEGERLLRGIPEYEADLVPTYTEKQITLASVIEDIFVLVEEGPYTGNLIPITDLIKCEDGRSLLEMLDSTARNVDTYLGVTPHMRLRYDQACWEEKWGGDLDEYNQKASDAAKTLEQSLSTLDFYDIIYGYSGEMTSPELLGNTHLCFRSAPKFVLRLKRNKVALMRFYDSIGDESLGSILKKPASWRKAAKQINIELEKDVADQIRASISLRIAIENYRHTTVFHSEEERHLASLTEAYADFESRGYKKILDEYEGETRLPHFLEIAYQRYVDCRSEESLNVHSRNLLTLLGRVPLYLMLEDLHAVGISNDTIDRVEREVLGDKPLSDGRLYDLQLQLINVLEKIKIEEGDPNPTIALILSISLPDIIHKHLKPLVEKRNRASHPPFDQSGFLEEAEKQFPLAITALRRAFSTLEILVPCHFESNAEGQITLTAKSLMGSYFEYPECKFKSQLDHFQTPTDTLLLCFVIPRQSNPELQGLRDKGERKSKKNDDGVERSEMSELLLKITAESCAPYPTILHAIPLNRFFKKKYGYKKMIMTGILDHVSNGEQVFEYIEE